MSDQLKNLKNYIREIINEVEEELDEATATGNVAGYQTPNAFGDDSKKSKKKTKDVATSAGYTIVNESIDYPKKGDKFSWNQKNSNGDIIEFDVEYVGNKGGNEILKVLRNYTSKRVISKHPDIYGVKPGDIIRTGKPAIVRDLKINNLIKIDESINEAQLSMYVNSRFFMFRDKYNFKRYKAIENRQTSDTQYILYGTAKQYLQDIKKYKLDPVNYKNIDPNEKKTIGATVELPNGNARLVYIINPRPKDLRENDNNVKSIQEGPSKLIPNVGEIDNFMLKKLLQKNKNVLKNLSPKEKEFMNRDDVDVISVSGKNYDTIFTDGNQEFEMVGQDKKLKKKLGPARPEIKKYYSKNESIIKEYEYAPPKKDIIHKTDGIINLIGSKGVQFILKPETKVFQKGSTWIFTDGKRAMWINYLKPVSMVKKLSRAGNNTKNLYNNAIDSKRYNEDIISESSKIPRPIQSLIQNMVDNKIQRRTVKIKNPSKHKMFMKDVKPAVDQKLLIIKHNPIDKDEMWISLGSNAQGKMFEDEVDGGLSDNKSLEDIANHHKVDIDELMNEYRKGIKVEMEHTSDPKISAEIARDHLYEDPKYYTKLATIENEPKNEGTSDLYGQLAGDSIKTLVKRLSPYKVTHSGKVGNKILLSVPKEHQKSVQNILKRQYGLTTSLKNDGIKTYVVFYSNVMLENSKITMNNLDWGKTTRERNSNLDKYNSLKSEKEKTQFLKNLKGESVTESKKKPVRTNRWLELKNDETKPNKKLAMGLKELKYKLREVENFIRWYNKISKMNELSSDSYWKRTNNHIYKIKERLINIAKTIQELEK